METDILFDIGGTKTRVAVATEEGIGAVAVVPTEKEPEEEMRILAALAAKSAPGARFRAAFGCVPATLNAEGGIQFAPNLPLWNGFRFSAELEKTLGAPATLEHDASLGALGEALYGVAKGARSVAYFGIGTGVGVGRVVRGAIDSPVVGFEVGHQLVGGESGSDLDGAVSGRGLERRHGVPPKDIPQDVYAALAPTLAAGVYNSILHWLPDVFVLGGSLMNEENGYRLADVVAALKKFPPYYPALPDIRRAALGDAANLWGARALALRAHGRMGALHP